jgi:photosystem II stability/assembly factor-like uncharacterized protein
VAIVVNNSNPSEMILGGGQGQGNSGPYTESGIYKTTNGGSSWSQSDTGLTDPPVNALWLDQSDPNIVLAGTNSSTGGIFRTTNGGASWTMVNNTPPPPVSAFLLPGGTLYAGAANGIYASTDSGNTWSLAYSTPVPARVLAGGATVIYAGLDNGAITVNSSGTWTTTAAVPLSSSVYSIAVNPSNGQNAFVVESNGYTAGNFFETSNGGTSWTAANPPSFCGSSGTSPCALQYVAIDPSTGYLCAGGDFTGIGQSTDGGATWSLLPSSFWDIRLIVPNAAGIAGNIIVGSDQGISQSVDSGATWESLNSNITSSILYGLAVNGSTILTSVQDYSPISSFDGGSSWQQLGSSSAPSGEAGSVLLNPGNPLYAYFFTTGQFQYSTDGGHSFTGGYNMQFSGSNGDIIAVDHNNPSTVYVAAQAGVYQSTNWGQSFTLLSSWPFSTSNQPTMVAVDPANSERIFVGTANGTLEFTTDGGTSWTTSSLPVSGCGGPETLLINPTNPDEIMTTIFGCGGGAIFRSTDGGLTFAVASNGIYNRPTQCNSAVVPHLTLDPSGSGIVAAATTGGLFLSSDFGSNWTSIRGNTVPYPVSQAVWSGGYLYQSTCGEGVLRMPFAF